jgi:hypothetical protein
MERVEHVLSIEAEVSALTRIDPLYAAFVATLPEALAGAARGLAVTLGLSPSRDVPWSGVFSHEITLGAPLLVAEALPELPAALVDDATLAHLLAVVEAFGTDRLEDGQVTATPALLDLLAHVRRARDAALSRVVAASSRHGHERPSEHAFQRADGETLAAISAERALIGNGEAVTFRRYLSISHGKQRVGLPASLALARAAGWDDRRTRVLGRLLDAVALGLQLHDDVIDWEDDLARGGAWAASLAALVPSRADAEARETMPVSIRLLVQQSGVLGRMLAAAQRSFRAARRRAEVLGAGRLARWAGEREALTGDLARHEADTPGFANRAHALSAWARTVLA